MLGRFLELTLCSDTIMASWSFYERLGFKTAVIADHVPTPYTVVSDGRVAIGLSGGNADAARLTFVRPNILEHAFSLEQLGLDISKRDVADSALNQMELATPDPMVLRLIEARTFSPPHEAQSSILGWFDEIVVATSDLELSAAFWETLGCVLIDNGTDCWPTHTLTSNTINIGLCQMARWKTPALLFSSSDLNTVRQRLVDLGITIESRLPRPLDADRHVLLVAPEGTPLIVQQAPLES